MPTIKIGQTQKRINSTSRVFYAGGTTINNVRLKEPCSIQTPVFLLKGLTKTMMYNFLQWEDRYYWIDDIVYVTNDLQEVHCHLDPLATFREAIEDTEALVIYGSSNYWHKKLDDVRFSPEISLVNGGGSEDIFGDGWGSTEGCVIMRFSQTTSYDVMDPAKQCKDNVGLVIPQGIHTAIMSLASFKDCLSDLTRFDIQSGDFLEMFQAAVRVFGGGSWMDDILSAVWVPIDLNHLVVATNAQYRYGIILGGLFSDRTTWYEPGNIYTVTHEGDWEIDLDSYLGADSGDLQFLRNERFLSVQVTLPGSYNDVATKRFLVNNSGGKVKLYLRSSLSIVDGSYSMKISSFSNYADTLMCASGSLGINMLSNVYCGPTNSATIADAGAAFVTAALAMGIGSVVAGAASAGVANTAREIGSVARNSSFATTMTSEYGTSLKDVAGGTLQKMNIGTGIMGGLPSTNKSISAPAGTFSSGASSIFMTSTPGKFNWHVDIWGPIMLVPYSGTGPDSAPYIDYCNKYGYPVNFFMRVGDNDGYVQCASANVEFIRGATEANKATINSFLNNGIYIEE